MSPVTAATSPLAGQGRLDKYTKHHLPLERCFLLNKSTSQTKQIGKTWTKRSSQQPPAPLASVLFISVLPPFGPSACHQSSSLELSMMRWASRVTTGHRSHMDEVVLPGFQLSKKLVPPTSSWKWMLPKINHRVDRVMQWSIDDSEMLWNALQNTKPFIQARPLLN